MPDPAWESATSGWQAQGSTTVAVTKPAGTVDGDLVVVHIAYDSLSGSPSSTGFTNRSQITEIIDAEANRPALSAVFTKTASGEGASWPFTIPNNGDVTWQAHRVSAGAFDAVTEAEEEPANFDLVAPSVTASVANCLHMLLGMGNQKVLGATWGPPAGYTERVDVSLDLTSFAITCATAVVAAGASGTKTLTMTGSASYAAAHSLSIKPAVRPFRGWGIPIRQAS